MDADVERMIALEREIDEKQKELTALAKRWARKPVADAELHGPDGPVALSALFGDRDELLVSFNMGRSCAYCTLWADEVAGVAHHLEQRAAFVVVSPDPPAVQQAFARDRGWRFRMLSHRGTRFAHDLGMASDDGGKTSYMPGVAAFRRTPDGIARVGMRFYGPGDPFCGVFHFLRLLDDAGEGFVPRIRYPSP